MANINGNNIDDLFRQASDHYPLRTDSADWAKLSDALEKDPSLTQAPVNEQENGRRRRKFFLLFFLLPLAGAGYFVWHSSSLKNTTIAKGQFLSLTPSDKGSDAVTTPRQKEATAFNKTGTGTTTLHQPIASLEQHTATLPQHATTPRQPRTPIQQPTITTQQHAITTQQHAITMQRYPATPRQHEAGIAAGTGMGAVTNRPIAAGTGTAEGTAPLPLWGSDNDVAGPAMSNHNTHNAIDGHKTIDATNITGPSDPKFAVTDVERALANQTYSLDITLVPGFAAPNSGAISKSALISAAGDKTATNNKKGTKSVKLDQPHHEIYVGLIGAPDLSTVKLQSIKGVGTTFGVLLGYGLNPKWSLETGLYLDRKKYYTDGQYFNKAEVPPLQYVNLQKVDGICNMLEIPINIRYNLNPLAKNKWFATAGLSTYLMSSEQYAYQATMLNGMPWDKTATYRTPSQNWFSIVNLSIGYEQKLGRMTNLRLEPYLRMPLSGIGTGSLPIMSAGLNVGITRKIR